LGKHAQKLNTTFLLSQMGKRELFTISSLLHKQDINNNATSTSTSTHTSANEYALSHPKITRMEDVNINARADKEDQDGNGLEQLSSGSSLFREGQGNKHFRERASCLSTPSSKTTLTSTSTSMPISENEYTLPHPIWSEKEAEQVVVTHQKPKGFWDHLAYYAVSSARFGFDLLSGYFYKRRYGMLTERDALARCIFLETVAGVPGMAAAAGRHFQSLRLMKRDNGWIHTLLEEAENERMHLMTFMELRKPGILFRGMVITTQFIFTVGFCGAYIVRPQFCHRFVGYLEEQAVITYTHILNQIDSGQLPSWSSLSAPDTAIEYWKLGPLATMRDVILVVRADEAHHRLVNHTLGSLKMDAVNPFQPGE